jgi:benzoate-CoA ligase family protein
MATPFNACDYLVDRQVREGNGGRTAVCAPGRTLTYDQLAEQIRGVDAGLRALGVRPEERVVLAMVDEVELLAGILAAMRMGAVPVPVSTMLRGPELGKLLADSRTRTVLASAEFADTVSAALDAAPEVTTVVVHGDAPGQLRAGIRQYDWAEFLAGGQQSGGTRPMYQTWEDSPALWLYTSGTTGEPKGAMHRHGSMREVAETYGTQVLGIRPDDRCLSVAKLFFAYGLGNSATFPLAVGAATILEPARPTPAGIAARLRAERPTLFFAVPTFYAALLAADLPADTFESVRLAVSAGEALPAAIYQRFLDRFGVRVIDGIGSTEALHIFMSNAPDRIRPGSSGVPVPGYEVQLRDDAGALITDAGRPGHLFVSGRSLATGYWCRAETTRRVFQGEWLRTGDTYVRNDDGTYTCLGRSDDMIKAGGIWVSPAEVEARLLEHPDVAEAAVVAAHDSVGLSRPVACVVPAAGRTIDDAALIAFCAQGLASFKRPRAVLVLDELPKTATGKLRRHVLREVADREFKAAIPDGPPADSPVEPATDSPTEAPTEATLASAAPAGGAPVAATGEAAPS